MVLGFDRGGSMGEDPSGRTRPRHAAIHADPRLPPAFRIHDLIAARKARATFGSGDAAWLRIPAGLDSPLRLGSGG